ncbi:leucyl/phenylalanyl-tRNA--protein transferase [Kineococcus rhizosphaerae]|uniref:Leucyl/phenylalanyl-tRNA--protein transferase n=1 Tax=Kineococcus rhizosphaerae TaxID=559628 RepID=A0A2T0R8H6_9ACTN|nr:leucyl/phenylalanyl-tRNA--protein transferase [Kineococcus rhizosphaerae]PRY17466.1 leucyl/phenylalanyl-tRNA--protein transferase [Kineococcus rhizosphaerae]
MWGAPFPRTPAGRPRFDVGPAGFGFDDLTAVEGEDLVASGGDLRPATLLEAYRHGFFPMGLGGGGRGPLGWWSPDPRGVLRPERVHVSRSLRRSLRRFEVRVDTAFDEVVAGCADPSRSGAWITTEVAAAYGRLHRLGWAHSVEVWCGGELAGGLYGLSLGGLFAAESKFHRVTDASKAAVVALADLLTADGVRGRLVDVQWRTDHLATLGIEEVPRPAYRVLLSTALARPVPPLLEAAGPARPERPNDYDGG